MTRETEAPCSRFIPRLEIEHGDLLFENVLAGWDRTAGNFGGDPGPKVEKLVPPSGVAPDFRVEYRTSPDQAALYRLSGDKNPLHIDPEFARLSGLERPILMGLCTYGFAGRAILHSICGSDPARFKSFSVRFTGMVLPGDSLITEGWKAERWQIHHPVHYSRRPSSPGQRHGRSRREARS